MIFLCQINLAEISNLHSGQKLPKNGMLYFFLYAPIEDDNILFDYTMMEYKVFYLNVNSSDLKTRTFPKNLDFLYQEEIYKYDFSFNLDVRICDPRSTGKVYQGDYKRLAKAVDFDDVMDWDLILGSPQGAQGPPMDEWLEEYKGKHPKSEDEFINLLSLTIEKSDMNLYFGIHKNDLKDLDFENIVCAVQTA